MKSFIRDNPGPLADATIKGLGKLQKYERLLDINNSKLSHIAIFLNPTLRIRYYKEHKYGKFRTFLSDIRKLKMKMIMSQKSTS